MKLKYYTNLDGIRAIAALMVIAFHSLGSLPGDSKFIFILNKVMIFGQTGVDLFFVLSGFLITRILIKTKNGNNYFLNFYSRRTLRIFPLYYLFLIVFYIAVPFLTDVPLYSFNEQIYFYTYFQNFSFTFDWGANGPRHYWSLAVEEHFYLFWPLCIYFFNIKVIKYLIFAMILFAIGLRIIMLYNGYGVFYFTLTRFDSLGVGALLALLEIKNVFLKNNKNNFLIATVFFLGLVALWGLVVKEGIFKESFKYLIYSLLYFSFIGYILCLKEKHLINRFLESTVLQFLGKISYGLYVYHPLVLIIMHKYLNTGLLLLDFGLMIAITIIIAHLSFIYFEKKFLNFKKYFIYK
jgi:peptidoglycan/LPS O-acetylase OafA/YrhL